MMRKKNFKLNFNYCYILQSTVLKKKTYIGWTVHPKRRLRQHNGEISGGANRTKIGRPWKMICYIMGFPSGYEARSFECYLHNPKTRRYSISGQLKTLELTLNRGKWKNIPFKIGVYWLQPGFDKIKNCNNYSSTL